MISVTKRFEWDASHRLYGYDGVCANVHGHHYVAEVTVTAPALDEQGMVVDFNLLNKLIGGWIDDHWDHAHIYNEQDEVGDVIALSGKHFTLSGNPTAENMAVYLMNVCRQLLADGRKMVTCVRLWETPDSYAEVSQ